MPAITRAEKYIIEFIAQILLSVIILAFAMFSLSFKEDLDTGEQSLLYGLITFVLGWWAKRPSGGSSNTPPILPITSSDASSVSEPPSPPQPTVISKSMDTGTTVLLNHQDDSRATDFRDHGLGDLQHATNKGSEYH